MGSGVRQEQIDQQATPEWPGGQGVQGVFQASGPVRRRCPGGLKKEPADQGKHDRPRRDAQLPGALHGLAPLQAGLCQIHVLHE